MIDQAVFYNYVVLNLIFDGNTQMLSLSFSFIIMAVTQLNHWDVDTEHF